MSKFIIFLLFFLLESNPNKLSKDVVKAELRRKNIEYEENESKAELVEKLQKKIGEETQNKIKGIYYIYLNHNFFI